MTNKAVSSRIEAKTRWRMAQNSLRNVSITLGIGIRGQGLGAKDQRRRPEIRG